MLRHLALVRTEVSEELSAPFIRVARVGELGTTLAVTSNRRTLAFLRSVRRLLVTASVVPSSPVLVTLMKEALSSSETSVLTRSTRRNIPEDVILHNHRCENLKSYITFSYWSVAAFCLVPTENLVFFSFLSKTDFKENIVRKILRNLFHAFTHTRFHER
jgi:hypothetical protein